MLVPPPPIPKGPPCTVGLLMERLPEAERDALAEMLADPVWTGVDIAAEIVVRGYTRIQGGTVSRHRRGACGCP
jgi:hypothetical protein